MVFWGVEVASGKPFHFSPDDDESSQLHISQATISVESESKIRTVLSVKVGELEEIKVCSLSSGVLESVPLDLIFEEEAIFSVSGPHSVHLSGYFMPISEEHHHHPDDHEDEDEDWDDEDEDDSEGDEDDVFDDEDEFELEDFLPKKPKSSVRIQEIYDDDTTEQPVSKSQEKAIVAVSAPSKASEKDNAGAEEDDDGFLTGKGKRVAEETAKQQPQKKKKKQAGPAESEGVMSEKVAAEASPAVKEEKKSAAAPSGEAPQLSKKERKAAKKAEVEAAKNKSESAVEGKAEQKAVGQPPAKAEKPEKKKAGSVRKFPNGLEVHEVSLGKPSAKQATNGKRVFMHYVGKLKSSGKQFDSSIGKKPFSFRLGVGEVIKGWDAGIQGMRVGDKRKLIIPPQMGYGAKGVPATIPGNAWLTFDVELLDVK